MTLATACHALYVVYGRERGMCSVASLLPPPPPLAGSPNPIPLSQEGSCPIEYLYNCLARRSLGVVWRRGWDVLSRFAPSASPAFGGIAEPNPAIAGRFSSH